MVAYVILAMVGGAARYAHLYLKSGKWSWLKALAHIFISGFSGFMFSQFGAWIGVSGDVLFLFAGLGGYMGPRALEIIEEKTVAVVSTKEPGKDHD